MASSPRTGAVGRVPDGGGVKRLTIGTRGSPLALWQARHVAARLQAAETGLSVSLRIIRTGGDRDTRRAPRQFSDKGIFVKEIEDALLCGEIDLAVHSLKDMPSRLPEGLALIAFPERADCRDALVTADGVDLAALPQGARVGTGALRRRAQLARARPDLRFIDLRGNVDTRLRKLAAGEVEAVVLAMAGLTRLGLAAERRRPLPPRLCLPAPGQGVLALEGCLDHRAMCEVVEQLDHAPTRHEVAAERGVLEKLDAGCLAPMGALARCDGKGSIQVTAMVATPDGTRLVQASVEGDAAAAADLGREVAARLRADGADEVLAEARRFMAGEHGNAPT